MWSGITAIVSSPNFPWVIVLILTLVLIGIVCSKLNILKIRTKHVQIGDSDDRELIRRQWTYATSLCEAQFNKIRKYCESEHHALYVISRVEDIFQEIVVYNHISDSPDYIRSKQELVYSAILKRTNNEYFYSDTFHQCCDNFVKKVLLDLYSMKKSMMEC